MLTGRMFRREIDSDYMVAPPPPELHHFLGRCLELLLEDPNRLTGIEGGFALPQLRDAVVEGD